MQSFSHASKPVQPATVPTSMNSVMGYVVLALPMAICLSIIVYRGCRVSKLRRQVRELERLWLLSSREPTA